MDRLRRSEELRHSLASHDWIFSLDADERIPPPLASEVRALLATEPARNGYRVPRVAYHLGRWVRTTDFYPDFQTRLYDRRSARWTGLHVHESVTVDGGPGQLVNELQHYSFRDLRDQLDRVNHYTTLAARQMYERGQRTGLLGASRTPAGGVSQELRPAPRLPRRDGRADDFAR